MAKWLVFLPAERLQINDVFCKMYAISPRFEPAPCQESALINEALHLCAGWLCELPASTSLCPCHYFNHTAWAAHWRSGHAEICPADTSFPVLPLMEMDSGGAELCGSLQVLASTQLCHQTACQCRGWANMNQALQDAYKTQTLNNCTPSCNIFPKLTISRVPALQSSPCLCDLRASFFHLQQICFLPEFVFLGTAAAQSMARASCQLCFSKSLHVAG